MNDVLDSVIVFDVDETLGCFSTLDIMCYFLETYNSRPLTLTEFNTMLDIFPELLRPKIITYLRYLKRQKSKKRFDKLVVYTNNTGPNEWMDRILNYLSIKVKKTKTQKTKSIFDNVIRAYEIEGKKIEPKRTEHSKTYDDLVRCLDVKTIKKACFIDDQYHKLLEHPNVSSLHIPAYYCEITKKTFVNRLLKSKIYYLLGDLFSFNKYANKYYNSDLNIPSYQILYHKTDDKVLFDHLKSFLSRRYKSKTTIKRNKKRNNKTVRV
jgi:hypothetical protein